MSFDTDLDNYNFAPVSGECATCFATGKTPEQIFFDLSDFQIGDDWTDSDAAPINGLLQLDYQSGCEWLGDDGTWFFLYLLGPAISVAAVGLLPATTVFTGSRNEKCVETFENPNTSPIGVKYHSGKIAILNPLESGTVNNVELMEKVAFVPETGLFCRPQSPDIDLMTNRYSRRSDHTNIHIEYDLS